MSLKLERSANLVVKGPSLLDRIAGWLSLKPKSSLEAEAGDSQMDLLDSIRDAKLDWISANANFEHAVDSQMVDYYAYKIKACEVRYQYLLKEAKEKGINLTKLN